MLIAQWDGFANRSQDEQKCKLLQYHFATSATGQWRVLHPKGGGQSCRKNRKTNGRRYKIANFLVHFLSIRLNSFGRKLVVLLRCKNGR